MKPLRSPREQSPVRKLVLLLAALFAAVISLQTPSPAFGQQGMNHGDRQGLIGIRNDAERQAFANLACTCGGCPHEAILTCPCSFADGFRDEVRAMISK